MSATRAEPARDGWDGQNPLLGMTRNIFFAVFAATRSDPHDVYDVYTVIYV